MSNPPTRQARQLLAQAIRKQGPAWGNTADSVEAGNWGNAFTAAALVAIDEALRTGPDDDGE